MRQKNEKGSEDSQAHAMSESDNFAIKLRINDA